MITAGALGVLNPWLLAGLAALPLLWWLLRAIPPRPKREVFAGVRLLLGLDDPERQAAKTPWWLLLMRCAAVAALILGFAGLVLNPSSRLSASGNGPVLILMDQGWADAPDWEARKSAAAAALREAEAAGRQVLFWPLASGHEPPVPVAAAVARSALDGLEPAPWPPDHAAALEALESAALPEVPETLWIHDGLAHGEATAALAERLAASGSLRLLGPAVPARAVTPPRIEDGSLMTEVLRAENGATEVESVVAISRSEDGAERRIAVGQASFDVGAGQSTVIFDLPPELIGAVTRVALSEGASAGGSALADASISRVRAVVVDPSADGTVASLTSASHYIRQALEPWADVQFRPLSNVLDGEPALIVLSDVGDFTAAERTRLTEWVRAGGLLLRFAGPRLAAAISEAPAAEPGEAADPLLPVHLRRGGRVLGGALAWGRPRSLGPFAEDSPFRRLVPPDEVDVRTQVLAQPEPDLATRVWARLDDGTPLVTADRRDAGRVVLFHVSADAEWSSLPLSGLFVEMLGRIVALAPGQKAARPEPDELAGTLWRAVEVLDHAGVPVQAPEFADPVPGEMLAAGRAGPDLPPGLYSRADAGLRADGAAESVVLNLFAAGDRLVPFPPAPAGAVSETLGGAKPRSLAEIFLGAALVLLILDVAATLWLSGRLSGNWTRPVIGAIAAGLLTVSPVGAPTVRAADAVSPKALAAASETTLGYVITGDPDLDRKSERALVGLGNQLARRTAVEPGPPQGVEIEEDDLSLYPVIYWPLVRSGAPTDLGLERLAAYLSGGGLLVIDTQNGRAGFNGVSLASMRQVARALNLPPLTPVDGDHVLSRTFYLLNAYPGRWRGGRVWAEAPPPGADGRPEVEPGVAQFDRVDDNVSPVIVGSADWAAAWAVDRTGRPIFPVGRPGDRQREMAIRFGINLVMYALTGNYKSDQVHAPAVLQRLGQ